MSILKKILFYIFCIFTTFLATAFTDEINVLTINMTDGSSIEYPIDSVVGLHFTMYYNNAYDIDEIYADPEYDIYNANEWDHFFIIDEDGNKQYLNGRRPFYNDFVATWNGPTWWEELEWFEQEDGSFTKILNKYTLIADESLQLHSKVYKNGKYTGFKIGVVYDKYPFKVCLIHEESKQLVAMYNFRDWGENDSQYDYSRPAYTVYKGFEIYPNGKIKKFSISEYVPKENWSTLEGVTTFSSFSFYQYINSIGECRAKPFGMMSGVFGRIPIIDHRSKIPTKVDVTKIIVHEFRDYDSETPEEYMWYQHPNYNEIVKDAMLAPQANE